MSLFKPIFYKSYFIGILLVFFSSNLLNAQNAKIQGRIISEDKAKSGFEIFLVGTSFSTKSDENGLFQIENIKPGKYILKTKSSGYEVFERHVTLQENEVKIIDCLLLKRSSKVNEVVVTGTKTFKNRNESSILVNSIDSKALGNLQVCNLSEGLKFQPGLRVETDCQTCNYTQLRIHGLQGGYSQILINGRPIFSPLMGLYGMEQIPVNMIEKIEIVRGGGSSLYGSSAVGGTVNVLTKLPQKNGYEINTSFQQINSQSHDMSIGGNMTVVNDSCNAGTTFFFAHRERTAFDANGDNFSEIPQLNNTSFGLSSFYRISKNQKLEVSINNLNEYRFGGEMKDQAAYLEKQSEERTHHIWMMSADYQINFNKKQSSFITYLAYQNTKRDHYTGIQPDSLDEMEIFLANPPYGNSNTTTIQEGIQLNHVLKDFFSTRNVLTLGTEIVSDKVFDQIPTYHYHVDQHTQDWGSFLQSDWDISKKLNILTGIRIDQHNMLSKIVVSPRAALLYKITKDLRFRLSYGSGFRAPQAFDTDLHIAFAAGGVSRVKLSPDLIEERSKSITTSLNFEKTTEKFIMDWTIEGFYTQLDNVFILQNIGEDAYGLIMEKQNGTSAYVYGMTLETQANFNKYLEYDMGFTFQKSQYQNEIKYYPEVGPIKNFLKTPRSYGYASINITPTSRWSMNVNYVFTGKMNLIHVGGAENFQTTQLIQTKIYSEINTKLTYTFRLQKSQLQMEVYTGVKNLLNAYQTDFDKGKNRDSNYMYGPNLPRSYFVGIKCKI